MRFRQSNLVGIDISESSIKVLQLNSSQEIVAYGTCELPPGVVTSGRILDADAFSKHLNTLLLDTKPQVLDMKAQSLRAVVCLPESALFTHYVTVPKDLPKAQLPAWVRDEASKMIPIPIEELYFDHHVVERDGRKKVTFVGVRKNDLDTYMAAFARANITPAFLVGELLSLGYALLPEGRFEDDYLVVDMGAHSTTIGIFGEDRFANASIVIPEGGEDITHALMEETELTQEAAEALKRSEGVGSLDEEPTDTQKLIRTRIDAMISEIEESRLFFEEKTRDRIERVVIAGGGALLPGLLRYLKDHLRTEVVLADPLKKIRHAGLLDDPKTPGLLFANVIGLALYALDTQPDKLNLLTQYRFQESDTNKQMIPLRDIRSRGELYFVVYTLLHRVFRRVLTFSGYMKRFNVRLNAKLALTVGMLIGAFSFLGWVLVTYI